MNKLIDDNTVGDFRDNPRKMLQHAVRDMRHTLFFWQSTYISVVINRMNKIVSQNKKEIEKKTENLYQIYESLQKGQNNGWMFEGYDEFAETMGKYVRQILNKQRAQKEMIDLNLPPKKKANKTYEEIQIENFEKLFENNLDFTAHIAALFVKFDDKSKVKEMFKLDVSKLFPRFKDMYASQQGTCLQPEYVLCVVCFMCCMFYVLYVLCFVCFMFCMFYVLYVLCVVCFMFCMFYVLYVFRLIQWVQDLFQSLTSLFPGLPQFENFDNMFSQTNMSEIRALQILSKFTASEVGSTNVFPGVVESYRNAHSINSIDYSDYYSDYGFVKNTNTNI